MWCDPEDRHLYCHERLGKGMQPRCPAMEWMFNDTAASFEDTFYPPDFTKPPQPRTHREYKLRAIDGLRGVLKWWIEETVEPERPVYWFYAYSYAPCKRRAIVAGGGNTIHNLITEFNYSHPAVAAELEDLWHNLNTKAIEWDESARGLQQSQCWIDPHRLDPVRVKEAAAQLLHKLRIVGSLVKAEQEADGGKGDTKEQPSADDTPSEDRAEDDGDNGLPPSRVKARAVYEYAMEVIPGAEKMTRSELLEATKNRLDSEIAKAFGGETEKLQELRESLPPNGAAFGKYLRDAGIKKYNSKGDRTPGRSIRRSSEI